MSKIRIFLIFDLYENFVQVSKNRKFLIFDYVVSFVSHFWLLCISSLDSKDKESRKRKVCRCGAGVEKTPNMCDTPGFPLRVESKLVRNLRGFDRLEVPQTDKRIDASSRWLLQGWRANCDIQFLLYECNHLNPNPEDNCTSDRLHCSLLLQRQ